MFDCSREKKNPKIYAHIIRVTKDFKIKSLCAESDAEKGRPTLALSECPIKTHL